MDEKNCKKQLYPGLEQLNLDELQELLRQEVITSDELDADYITAILEVTKRRAAEDPDYEPFDVDAGWQDFEENYMGKKSDYIDAFPHDDTLEVISTVPKAYRQSGTRRFSRNIAAAIVLVLFIGTLTAQALGYNVVHIAAQWTSGVFTFGNLNIVDDDLPLDVEIPPYKQFESIQEVLDIIGVVHPIAPKWYPDGFVQTELIVVQFSSNHIQIVEILEYESRVITVSITAHNMSGIHEINEDNVQTYLSGGITHYIMSNYERMVAVWMNRNVEGSIHGDITEVELKQMIDSIYGG